MKHRLIAILLVGLIPAAVLRGEDDQADLDQLQGSWELTAMEMDGKATAAKDLPGKVTVTFSNPSSVPHAVEIEGNGVEEKTETVTGADAAPLEVELQPGTYTYYCPVGGHEEAGMKGTLTVE